ncbi:hypothetical protein [Flavobacterium sp.]|uniref:hypothetical protein n=1 Tax=Flavobacterium sp. TaxID=239 RepID=UPI0039E68252
MSQIFEKIVGVIGWLQIVASPLLFGVLIGSIVYFPNPNSTKMYLAVGIVILGLIIGILLANRIWKTKGTMAFLSRIDATPDIDEAFKKEIENKQQSEKEE